MDEFTREMERILEGERLGLLNKLRSIEDEFRSESSVDGDDADIASGEESHASREMFNAMDTRKLKSIDAALKRIRNGHYGYCVACGKKIPEGRLRAMPSAVLCIECKEKQERMRAS